MVHDNLAAPEAGRRGEKRIPAAPLQTGQQQLDSR